jgi:hypothetical protein
MEKRVTIKQQLINMYGQTCFLGGSVDNKNIITYHHIKPVREGRETTVENGALLSLQMHWLFNKFELLDPEFAKELNEYFIYYKKTKDEKKRLYMYRKAITLYQILVEKKKNEKKYYKKKILHNI